MKASSHIEWCNENEGRAYPLAEDASRIDDNGNRLPDDIIADLCIIVPEHYTELRISSVYVSADIVSVAISSETGGLLVGSFSRGALSPYGAYPLTPLVDNVSGWIVFGQHRAVIGKRYSFSTSAQAGIEVHAVHVVYPPYVTRLQHTSNDPAVYIDGIIRLEGGPAFDIHRDPVDPQLIVVRLRDSMQDTFVEGCSREADEDSCGVPPIRRIANVPPDSNGQLNIVFK